MSTFCLEFGECWKCPKVSGDYTSGFCIFKLYDWRYGRVGDAVEFKINRFMCQKMVEMQPYKCLGTFSFSFFFSHTHLNAHTDTYSSACTKALWSGQVWDCMEIQSVLYIHVKALWRGGHAGLLVRRFWSHWEGRNSVCWAGGWNLGCFCKYLAGFWNKLSFYGQKPKFQSTFLTHTHSYWLISFERYLFELDGRR